MDGNKKGFGTTSAEAIKILNNATIQNLFWTLPILLYYLGLGINSWIAYWDRYMETF